MINEIPETYQAPIYLFHQGTNLMTYDFLGCHKGEKDGRSGYYFRVWAEKAQSVSVVGDFNDWNGFANICEKIADTGIWEAFIEGLKTFDTYKFAVTGCDGKTRLKADPYGTHMELKPGTG